MSVHFLTTVAGRKDRTSYVCVIVCVSVCVKHKYQIQNQIFILFIYLFIWGEEREVLKLGFMSY